MNVLVVVAHPDDEILGVGGSIARHVLRGDRVTVAILGSGISSRYTSPDQVDSEKLSRLRDDAWRAMALLGVTDLRLFDLPDNRFDSLDLLDIVKKIENLLDDTHPETLYTHFHGDLNIDHQVAARAVLTACRPLAGSSLRRLLAFEVPSATGWGFPDQPFTPTVFSNIGETLELKLAAIAAYHSEIREFPHPRSIEALKARALSWGSQSGLTAAEPFMLIRELC